MDNIKISIIMGIYNCEKYLSASIESVLKQTYTNWQLIMCDDGSTDNTYKIAEQYKQKYKTKIILLKNKKNMGLNYTLNECLKYANTEYVARQDGDDISVEQRLEKELEFLENHKEYVLVSSNMIYFDEFGEWGKSNLIRKPEKEDFVKGSPFCHAPCMIRKKIYDEVKGYTIDKKLLRVEDYHLWFKIYEKGYKGYNLEEALYKMRDDKAAISRRKWSNRINEFRVKYIGFRMLKLPFKYYIYILKPILTGIIPKRIYTYIHRNRLKGEK